MTEPKRTIFDISPPITAARNGAKAMDVFPGDTPPSREILLDMTRGDNLTLSTIRSTVHVGAHADGENHYLRDGRAIDGMPLQRYIGPCHVVSARVQRSPDGARAGEADLSIQLERLAHPRVLIRTGTQPDKAVFNTDFAGLEPALIDALADRGITIIGIDTPSVDTASSKDLPAHAAVGRRGMSILEGLVLDDAPDGEYELIALPLRLIGFDASPVRAILRPLRD